MNQAVLELLALYKPVATYGVDSGQVLVCSSKHLIHWREEAFEDIRKYKHVQTGKVYQYMIDFPHFAAPCDFLNGATMNYAIAEGLVTQIPRSVNQSFSYDGACSLTLTAPGYALTQDSKNQTPFFVTRTAMGDGQYDILQSDNGFFLQVVNLDDEDEGAEVEDGDEEVDPEIATACREVSEAVKQAQLITEELGVMHLEQPAIVDPCYLDDGGGLTEKLNLAGDFIVRRHALSKGHYFNPKAPLLIGYSFTRKENV